MDRGYGPSVPPAIAEASGRRILIYTEGFGDNPPDGSATPSRGGLAESVLVRRRIRSAPFDSHVVAIDLDTQEPVWDDPVQLDAVSRTGVTVDGDTAYLGDNTGTVYAFDVATGEVRWTADAGGFLTTALAVSDGAVVATVQADRHVALARDRARCRRRLHELGRGDEQRGPLRVGSRDLRGIGRGGVLGPHGPGVRCFGRDGAMVHPAQSADVLHGRSRVRARHRRGVRRVRSGCTAWIRTRASGCGTSRSTNPSSRSPVVVAGATVLVATSSRSSRGDRPGVGSPRLAGRGGSGPAAEPRAHRRRRRGRPRRARPRTRRLLARPRGPSSSRSCSPTELNLPKLLGNFLAAAVPLVVAPVPGGAVAEAAHGAGVPGRGRG